MTMRIFDRARLNEQSDGLVRDRAADRPPRPIAQKRAAAALRLAATLLGLHGRMPAGGARRRGTARRNEPLPPRLQEAADLRADLAEALMGALDYAAGREGSGYSGPDNSDDAALAVTLLLAAGNACHDAAASLVVLAGTPHDQPERKDTDG